MKTEQATGHRTDDTRQPEVAGLLPQGRLRTGGFLWDGRPVPMLSYETYLLTIDMEFPGQMIPYDRFHMRSCSVCHGDVIDYDDDEGTCNCHHCGMQGAYIVRETYRDWRDRELLLTKKI